MKSIYTLFFLLTLNSLYSQSNTTKWRSGFALSSGINGMISKPIKNNNNIFTSSSSLSLNNTRTWKFHYKTGVTAGFFAKRSLGDYYALQGEANLLWSRQEAELSDVPPSITDPQFSFVSLIERKGTIKFNTLYLQIPLIISRLINEETSIEGGLFLSSSLLNSSKSQLKVTTFSSFDNQTGRFTVFTPPRVLFQTADVTASTRLGWVLGIQHNITNKIAIRFRYEGSFSSHYRDFTDLREQRIWVGLAFRLNQK
jgi:hypothetical protein